MLRDSENEEPAIPYFVWNVEMTFFSIIFL